MFCVAAGSSSTLVARHTHADGWDLTWMLMDLIQMVYYPTDSYAGATTDGE